MQCTDARARSILEPPPPAPSGVSTTVAGAPRARTMGKDESMQEVDSLAAQSAKGAHQSATGEVFTREQRALIRDEWLAPQGDEIRQQAQDTVHLELLYTQ